MEVLKKVMTSLKTFSVVHIVFLYNISGFLLMIGSGTLVTQKICYPEGSPGVDVVCTDDQALKESAQLNMLKMNIKGFLPGVVVLLAGSWRDQTGLIKPLLIIPHIGDLVAAVVDIFSAIFWDSSLWATVVTTSFLGGITGSRALLMMASHIYITEFTAPSQRASRLSALNVAIVSSICVAMAASGFLLSSLGFAAFFIFATSLNLLSLVATIFLIKDGERKAQSSSGGLFSSLSKFKVMLQPKPNNKALWLFLIATAITISTMFSEMSVGQIFMQKKFQFTPKEGGLYGSYKMVLNLLTSAATVPIFKNVFKLSDFGIGMSSLALTAVSSFGMAVSNDITLLYVFDALSVFRITAMTTLRSLLSMCLKKSEAGVYTSFLSFSEGVLPIVLSPVYTYVFTHTVETMPGAFFLISGVGTILTGIIASLAQYNYVEIPEEEDEKKKQS